MATATTKKTAPTNVAPQDEAPTEQAAPLEPEPEAPPKPAPKNVIEAIARVELEIGGIRKLTPEQRRKLTGVAGEPNGITFAYRGIDQIAAAAQQLFGEYGVVIVPNIVSMDVEKVLKGYNATMETTQWTRTTMTVRYDLYGPGGVDDTISSTVIGVGDDNSDKGANKAATGAFKNLLLRILCIGDPQDDTDQYQNPNPDGDHQPAAPPADPIKVLFGRVKQYAGTPFADEMMDAAKAANLKLTESNLKGNAVLRTKITEICDAADQWAERERAREADEANVTPEEAEAAAVELATEVFGAEVVDDLGDIAGGEKP
jgi:hypothetical protein